MKIGIRTPSLKKRLGACTSVKRMVRHHFGVKAPRGMGWLTNPKRAAYNRVYRRTTIGCITFPFLGLLLVLGTLVASCGVTPTATPFIVVWPSPTYTATPRRSPTQTPTHPLFATQTADAQATEIARSQPYTHTPTPAQTPTSEVPSATATRPPTTTRLPTASATLSSQQPTGTPQASACPQGCAVATPPPGCLIKGNVKSKGERIYHAPGMRDHDRTLVRPAEGDRWFCTEAEAVAAGFRRAQR